MVNMREWESRLSKLRRGGVLAVACALALAGCNLPGLNQANDGTVTTGGGTTVVHLQNHALQLRGADGQPLDGLQLVIGGQTYGLVNGKLAVPSSVINGLGKDGVLVVLAKGYVPMRVSGAALDQPLQLTPATPVASQANVPVSGATLTSGDGGLAVGLPSGFFATAGASVDVARYTPTVPDKASSSGPALGVLLTLSQPVTGGQSPTVTLDLTAMLRGWDGKGTLPPDAAGWTDAQRQDALMAASILQAAQNASAQDLAKDGITYSNGQLTVTVPLTSTPSYDGNVKVVVDSAALGVYIEITVVSPVTGSLPGVLGGGSTGGTVPVDVGSVTGGGLAGGLTGGTGGGLISDVGGGVISDAGGGIITNNGANILSTYGGGILSTYGGGLVSNNGGNLVGEVRAPFQVSDGGNTSKFRLLTFTDFPVPNSGRIVLADETGLILGPTAPIDGVSRYSLAVPPNVRPFVFPEAQVGGDNMRALAPALASRRQDVDINAATTGVTSWAVRKMATAAAKMKQLSYAGYQADVAALRGFMSQTDAVNMLTGNVTADAALADSLYVANGYSPQIFNPIRGLVTTVAGGQGRGHVDGLGDYAQFNGPAQIAEDASGLLYLADRYTNSIRTATQAGQVGSIAISGVAWQGPQGIAVDPTTGNLIIANTDAGQIVRVNLATNVGTVIASGLAYPLRVVVAPDGTIYFTEKDARRIGAIAPDGTQSVLAGGGGAGLQDGPGDTASFDSPGGLTLAPGALYVCDWNVSAIRKIDLATKVVSTFSTDVPYPSDIAYDDTNELLFIRGAHRGNGRASTALWRLDVNSRYATNLAGNTGPGRVDGLGGAAGFYGSSGMWMDEDTGILWETDGDALRKIQ